MKAIVNTAPGKVELLDWPTPQPGPGQVRIRTLACGVCATDLEMIAGATRIGFPAILGHEWSGRVDAVGEGVDRALLGRKCVAENVWSTGGEVGFEHPGGYGEFLVTEAAKVQVLPEGYSAAAAALIEPTAVCVRALRRARYAEERAALVIGDWPIGLILVMLLRGAGGGEVSLVGGRPKRLALARELGAAATLNYHEIEGDLGRAICDRLGRRFPLVFEASGSGKAMRASLDAAAPGGRILVLGDYGQARADVPWNHLLHNELELIGSNASAEAWPEAVRLAVEDRIPLDRLITHRFPAARGPEAVEVARTNRDAIKVAMEWE
ncbi:MAG: zinc-binding dehydrogenase [Candidatus Sumerlaeota bacterium]|nr:zinc-binding dehydrogenase [Candidatus Sumerlaeota bacterium]